MSPIRILRCIRNEAALGEDGRWTVVDLGSTNGVQINGARATSPTVLKPGDRLDIGTVSARFEVE